MGFQRKGGLARLRSPMGARQFSGAPVISGLNTATPLSATPSSYAATISSGIGEKSATRRKSRNDVPVDALSVLGAPRLLLTSSMLTVRKSILQHDQGRGSMTDVFFACHPQLQ
jgi:hypothetical protein